MSESVPRQFGKYVLLKSLARGGMGEIYLAASGQSGGLNKLCVIKKVITEKADHAKINRFMDEAKVVLRLSHANLVSTFDAGDVGGELFIAMELIEGKDLREIWNRCVRTRTRIPVDVALVVAREIARALAYVHSYAGLRLVHRDVAPPNILLSYFGEVKLTDFGLARSILKQEHTAPGVVFGRASYLAPEQARGEVADARTDVYSLGVLFWELLTGQPYLQLAGLDPVTSLSLVRNPKTQPPSARAPWIAPELDAIVLKALAADRSMRFQSADGLREALSDAMTRVAPRADSERIAAFLRGLYRGVVDEEAAERERLLTQTLPRFRGEPIPDSSTPRTTLIPTITGRAVATVTPGAPGSSRDGDRSPPSKPVGAQVLRIVEAPRESLHVSALRARADSHGRRAAPDSSAADAPTRVWRKRKEVRDEEASRTFVGRVIDNRYHIDQRIGEGGMGTVYAARHVEIGKNVAVKILHRMFTGEEQLVERFRREARAASQVGHPHIVDVTDFGATEEGCSYFVMELLDGTDLASVLTREGRIDAARAVRIAMQICQALEAAHNTGIIHRDLKPENIFLVAREGLSDFVKVLDFGIARNLTGESRRLTNPGMAMGTPEYMAPEQAQGKPVDRRTDVYALGALLHEMVTGVAPFQAHSQRAMLEAKRRPLPSLRKMRPDIPADLDAIILGALSPDPERRPQTMESFERKLATIVWPQTPSAPDTVESRGDQGQSVAGAAASDFEKRLPVDPWPSDGVQLPDALTWNPTVVPARADADMPISPIRPTRRRGRAAILLMLVVVGAAAARIVIRGAPEFTRHRVEPPRNRPDALLKINRPGAGATLQPRSADGRGASVVSAGVAPALPVSGSGSSAAPRSSELAVPNPPRGAPEIVPTPPLDRARTALSTGAPDDAVAVLRPAAAQGDGAAKVLLAEALVASGWNDAKVYRWNIASRKAKEALALVAPTGPSRGAHALLGEVLYAQRDFAAALGEFTKALAESPRDARLKRRVVRSRRQLHHPESEPESDPEDRGESAPGEAASEQ